MKVWPTPVLAPRIVRAAAFLSMIAVIGATIVSPAGAQTLTNPNAPVKPPSPQADGTMKPLPLKRAKSCSQYGDGFIYVPGSDTCMRIGGSVQYDVRGRPGN